ncbi:MAG: GNAT family N-acetyltransferase [Ilumatobacteraceae bacterium]
MSATHRRRGLLTELMGRVHADALSRGEPVSILHASEAVIYGRFGYGVTTSERAVRIDRAEPAGGRSASGCRRCGTRTGPTPGARRTLWDRGCRLRPGELTA